MGAHLIHVAFRSLVVVVDLQSAFWRLRLVLLTIGPPPPPADRLHASPSKIIHSLALWLTSSLKLHYTCAIILSTLSFASICALFVLGLVYSSLESCDRDYLCSVLHTRLFASSLLLLACASFRCQPPDGYCCIEHHKRCCVQQVPHGVCAAEGRHSGR